MDRLSVKSRVNRKTNTTKAVLSGELTIYDATAFRDRLLALLSSTEHLSIDAQAISEVDLAGVQVLVALRNEAAQRGATFTLARAAPSLTQALKLLGLTATFHLPVESGAR